MAKREPRPGEGRPPKYKPEYCAQLVEHMKQGYGINTFGAKVGVARDTPYSWRNDYQQFKEAFDEGMAHYELFWETIGIQGTQGLYDKFNAAAWIFNMKNRFKWTDRQETTHETGEGFKIILEDYLERK